MASVSPANRIDHAPVAANEELPDEIGDPRNNSGSRDKSVAPATGGGGPL